MAGGEPLPIGVGEDGQLQLPWLQAPLDRAQRLTHSHALLLHAGVAVGQFELAMALTQGWLCERDRAPCGQCRACRQVRQRAHPDHRVIVPDAMRLAFGWLTEDDPLQRAGTRPSRELRVEQVRDVIEWSQRSAGSARGRALVLHPGDALNHSAANALLKTLEEPPGSLRIVLTGSDPDRLLPTLRSRVQRVRLPMPDVATAMAWLQRQGVPEAAEPLAAAGGSPVEALTLVGEGIDAGVLRELPLRVSRGDASSLVGKPIARVVDLLLKFAHDAMAHAVGAAPRYFDADRMPRPAALASLQAWRLDLLRVARHDDHPWSAALLVESLVTNGARCWPVATTQRAGRTGHSLHSTG